MTLPHALPAAQPPASAARAVFFDVVGTVLIPEPSALEVYQALAGAAGANLPLDLLRTRFIEAYRKEEASDRAGGWLTSESRERTRWRNIVTYSLRGIPDPDATFETLYHHFATPQAWRLAPEVEPVIAALRDRGTILGLGSNYDQRLLSVLDGFPVLAALRPRTIISSAIGVRKPAAGFFRAVVEAAGVQSHEVLFVGDDDENDYLGARAAGLASLLYDPDDRRSGTERIRSLGEVLWRVQGA